MLKLQVLPAAKYEVCNMSDTSLMKFIHIQLKWHEQANKSFVNNVFI